MSKKPISDPLNFKSIFKKRKNSDDETSQNKSFFKKKEAPKKQKKLSSSTHSSRGFDSNDPDLIKAKEHQEKRKKRFPDYPIKSDQELWEELEKVRSMTKEDFAKAWDNSFGQLMRDEEEFHRRLEKRRGK